VNSLLPTVHYYLYIVHCTAIVNRFYTAWLVASKLTRLKSCWLFCLEYHAREYAALHHAEIIYEQIISKISHQIVKIKVASFFWVMMYVHVCVCM